MSLQARVLGLSLALLLVVLGVTLATVSRATYRHTLDRAEEELVHARRLLIDKLDSRQRALGEAASALAKEDALRQAIFAGAGDAESVRLALDNHRLRTSADLSILVDLDGIVLADTGQPAASGRPFAFPELLAEGGTRVLRLGDRVFQIVAVPYYVPVSAPRPSLWLLLGRVLDDRLALELRDLVGVEVAIVAGGSDGRPPRAMAASWSGEPRAVASRLAMPAGDTVEIRELGDADYLITAAPLAAADTPPVTALLMRPTAEALLDYRELLGRFVALAALSALLAAGGAVLVARGVSRPIRGLAEAAQRIAAGDYAAELPLRGAGEVGRLAREFAAMQQAVGERETAIEYLAYHDDLTGLANRNRFRDEIARRISVTGGTAERRGRLAIVVLDLDRFREINDTLGHHIGDRLLLEIAGRLRREAAGGNLVAARLGGDEFGLLLAVEGVGDARRRIEELRHRLGEPSEVDDVRLDLEASFGIALHPDHGGDPATLLRQAEVAMYVAKERRLGVAFYDSSQDRHSIERLSLVGDLRRAIESESLELVFQPKLDLRSGRADEVEVLLRWHHPRRGALSPAEFVPIAEQTGLIRPLTAWVLERATAELAAWARGGDPLAAAVNLSALDLHDPELGRRILETLARHGVAPSLLTLEITESSVLEEPETARRILDQVTAAGVRVSIDDFGTGYSSLAQLKRLPVTELKIDRSFVAEMGRSPDVRQIVRSAIELGHNLGLEVVAEGVESDETLAALRDMGCDKAQGFGISEPLTAGELASWIAARAGGRAGVAS